MNLTISHYLQIVALAALTSAFTSCSNKETTLTETAEEELPKVEVSVVTARDVPQTNDYTATVEAENINNIAPSTPNRIKTIKLDQIQREYDRALKLLEIGAGTQQSVDQLKAQLDAAKSQYGNLIENTVLTSPISGVVTARNYDPGDMTGNLPVLTVGQLSPVVKVMINVTESDLSKIRTGMPVTVAFDAFEGETFDGKVSRIYPTVDTATRTFRTEILISNPGERILPGMFARVSIDLGSRNNVVVPDRAIVKQTGSGNRYVYVLHDGKVNFERVELGRRLGDAYELISGVNSGDTVVISGQTRLADGVEVEVM